jgi:hypothetical protein
MSTRRIPLALILFASGCLGDFKTPSAYQDQRFLCDDAHAADFQAVVDGCQKDGSCAGAFSMQGTMQGEALTVETALSDASFTLVQMAGSTVAKLDRVNLNGASPYFDFVFHMKSVGGLVTAAGDATGRDLSINGGSTGLMNPLDDDQVDVGQLLEAAGASSDQAGRTGSGTVSISYLSTTELRGTFHGSFGDPSDSVVGCFDAIPAETNVNPTPSQ